MGSLVISKGYSQLLKDFWIKLLKEREAAEDEFRKFSEEHEDDEFNKLAFFPYIRKAYAPHSKTTSEKFYSLTKNTNELNLFIDTIEILKKLKNE
jgi:hypothetical protein